MPAAIRLTPAQFLVGPRKPRPCPFGSSVGGAPSSEVRGRLNGRLASASQQRRSTPSTMQAALIRTKIDTETSSSVARSPAIWKRSTAFSYQSRCCHSLGFARIQLAKQQMVLHGRLTNQQPTRVMVDVTETIRAVPRRRLLSVIAFPAGTCLLATNAERRKPDDGRLRGEVPCRWCG